jgi:hypothetical protein
MRKLGRIVTRLAERAPPAPQSLRSTAAAA